MNQIIETTYKTPNLFWINRPHFFTLIKIFYNKLNTLYSLKRIDSSKAIKIDSITLPTSLIITEIENVIIRQSHYLIMNYWLNSYKKKLNHKVKFFYEDEFYPNGRAISSALKDLNTFGVQHSMITKSHSVYHISDKETNHINKNDGLPLPHQFIVWGDYFKKQFLSYNSLKDNFVYVAGNPTYINRSNHVEIKNNDYLEILYCLTTPKIFAKEKNILKDTLESIPNLRLKIRFHPSWKFSTDLVLHSFKNINVTFSNEKNIFNAIIKSSLVLAGSHSGVWLDSIVANKPVIRLITSFKDNIAQDGLVINVENENEMGSALTKALNNKLEIKDNDLLYLKNNRWRKLLEDANP